MTNEKEYYAKDLNVLRERVRHCSRDVLNSLVFFMEEANKHATGISDDVVKEIKDEVAKFRKNDCDCGQWMRKY